MLVTRLKGRSELLWPLISISFISLIYLLFPINIHSWEPYWFAAGLEDLFHVTSIYEYYRGMEFPRLNFDLYHPNHPLLHLISFGVYRALGFMGFTVRTITVIRNINIMMGILSLILTYRVGRNLLKSAPLAAMLTLLMGFTDIYWYYAMSGEVYIAPYAMTMLSFYLLLRMKERLVKGGSTTHLAVGLGVSFSLALGFHLISAPFGLVMLLSLLIMKYRYRQFKLAGTVLAAGSIIALSSLLLFVLLPVSFVGINSFSQYREAMTIGTPGSGFNPAEIPAFLLYRINSLLNSLIRTDSPAALFYKGAIALLFLAVPIVTLVKREHLLLKLPLFCWLGGYFLIITVAIYCEVDDYWLTLIFPFFLLIVMSMAAFIPKRLLYPLLALFIGLNFYLNFTEEIYPKHRAGDSDYALLGSYRERLMRYDNFIFIYNYGNENYLDELWYVNYFLEKPNVALLKSDNRLAAGQNGRTFRFSSPNMRGGEGEHEADNLVLVSRPGHRQDELQSYLEGIGFRMEEERIVKMEDTRYEKLAGYPLGYRPQRSFRNEILVQFYDLSERED